jgi:hypothetical protein
MQKCAAMSVGMSVTQQDSLKGGFVGYGSVVLIGLGVGKQISWSSMKS